MVATQDHPLDRNPNNLNLVQVTSYKRRIHANIDRVWENVLDWQHLAWLHDSSFDYVTVDSAGEWGWRTWSNPEQSASVELCVNREQSEYVARSYQANDQISEIWTRLLEVGDHTDIEVTFALPDIEPKSIAKISASLLKLYSRLWDEDEDMMQKREARLRQRVGSPAPSELRLEKPFELPLTVTLGRGDWTIREVDGQVLVHSAICPHLLGPLAAAEGTRVSCPWHGYQFDIVSGNCLAPADASCRLKTPPEIQETDTHLTLTLHSH
jgi:nitrite reductase/ring-hydroxylating ferredoxin subunit